LGLIQAAGISQTIPNPDGEYPDPSGDFRGQGISNIASGLFKGLPLGCQPFFAHCDAGDLSGYIDSRNSRGCFYWHHFFNASARTMEDFLPKADQAKRAVVILRLHGRSRIGSTFIQIVERYAGRLEANGGKLMLSGVSQHVWDQLERTETFETIPESDVFKADEALGNATKQAATAAKEWLASLPEAEYTSSSGNDLAR
jgi:MFS superfamily sulfate permease-like transporter